MPQRVEDRDLDHQMWSINSEGGSYRFRDFEPAMDTREETRLEARGDFCIAWYRAIVLPADRLVPRGNTNYRANES